MKNGTLPPVSTLDRPECKFLLSPKQPQQQYEPSTWVKLLELPNPYSFDEALLMCEYDDGNWSVWIPNHGEAVLSPYQFCHLDSWNYF
ncbi:hypothetical protein [Pseudanabaena sp. PCC 6802]|uniref:hypothetical protein n=1 Tax=Pseudanabaena sp. PCC 6802 TaxID=118173 RepID=UPI00034B3BA0|nr:hypothetical protein [Pseudanabaena sp. PCC 6802]